MMRRITTTLMTLVFAMQVWAQDIHFSQFYMAPLDLNPALTGVMNCKMRFSANMRTQWWPILQGDAYNTVMISYDQKVPVGRYDYFGFGGNLWRDAAGELNFATIQFRASGSYSKRLGGDRHTAHYLVFGINGGLAQRSIDFQNARWGSQHDGKGGWNPNAPPEPLDGINTNFLFTDLSVGALWYSIFNGGQESFYLGVAMSHLDQANVSFYRTEVAPLYSKLTVHAGGEIRMNRSTSLVPGIVYFDQGPSWEVNGGTNVRFILSDRKWDKQSFDVGVWARVSNGQDNPTFDAIILTGRFDFNNYGVGFSYDINTSSLRKANAANNAVELSLVYQICAPERRGVYCPNF